MRYAVVIEKGESNYSAYVPDLPGCVAVGDTLEETQREIQEAIEFHLEGMRADGLPIPEPSSCMWKSLPSLTQLPPAVPKTSRTRGKASVGRSAGRS